MLRHAQHEDFTPSSSTTWSSLTDAAVAVFTAAEPTEKVRLTRAATAAWQAGAIAIPGRMRPPDRPARPARPRLLAPRDMPKRKGSSRRVALLHAIAHIELNAIDLAWDLIARFADDDLPRAFFDDWIRVASEEAKHYGLLAERLAELDAAYGDLPAHDGLWQAATETAHDLLARLATVPLVLEARGLDVTPAMIADLTRADDTASAAILQVIYDEEIGHVAIGRRWFEAICAARGLEPLTCWQGLVRRHFKGMLKPPFNEAARDAAGFPAAFYGPLANG